MPVAARTKALTLLTVQNATIVLITRASRIGRPDELYTVSTAVFVTEVSSDYGKTTTYRLSSGTDRQRSY